MRYTLAVYWASPGSGKHETYKKVYDYMQLHVIYKTPTVALWNTYIEMGVNNIRNPKKGLQSNITTLLSKGELKWISHF